MKRSLAIALLITAVAVTVSIAYVRRTSSSEPSRAVRDRMRLADLPRDPAELHADQGPSTSIVHPVG